MGVFWRVIFYKQKGRFRLLKRGMHRWLQATIWLLEQKIKFGRPAGEEDLARMGETCPICFDNFQSPIVMKCSPLHVFCERCIFRWLQEKHFCPICRTHLPGLLWTDGSTLGNVIYR